MRPGATCHLCAYLLLKPGPHERILDLGRRLRAAQGHKLRDLGLGLGHPGLELGREAALAHKVQAAVSLIGDKGGRAAGGGAR